MSTVTVQDRTLGARAVSVIIDAQTKSVCALSYIFLLEYSSVYSHS